MDKPMVEIVGLKKYFKTRDLGLFGRMQEIRAIDDVSLQLQKGEIVGLIGESGSGKTTLARVILGLTNAKSGKVMIDGEDITAVNKSRMKEIRSSISVVFQDPVSNLNPRETVGSSIIRPLLLHGVKRKEAEERALTVIKKVKLDERYLKSFPHQLSGGQLQRIAIARALVMEPKLMILDEPTSALDISVQAQILNILLDIQESQKLTYLVISHDLNSIRYVSDKVAVMYLGNLVEFGETKDIFKNPRHPYTMGLMSSAPITTPSDRGMKGAIMMGEPGSLINISSGCRFSNRCQYVEEQCKTNRPELYKVSDNHLCACVRNKIQYN